MDIAHYQRITRRLIETVESDDRMIGLLALGSMADEERVDEWSDHDFWIVAPPEHVDEIRSAIGWLPDGDRIVFWFADTEHGRAAVYDDGHLLEYAVFAPDELEVALANEHRVLVGGDGLEEMMHPVVARTEARAEERRSREPMTVGRLIVHLVIGLGRYARGELLSSHSTSRTMRSSIWPPCSATTWSRPIHDCRTPSIRSAGSR